MEKKDKINFDKEALDNLKIGECLEAEITFPGDDEPMKMKVCKTKKGLEKKFIEVTMTSDRLTAELNEASYFAFQEFQYSKIDTEIAC